MRVFWGIIAALMLLGGVVLGASWYQSHRAADRAQQARAQAEFEAQKAREAAEAALASASPRPPQSAPQPPPPSPSPTMPSREELDQAAKAQERAIRDANPNLPVVVTPAEPVATTPAEAPTPAPAKPEVVPPKPTPAPPPPTRAPEPARDDELPPAVLPDALPAKLGEYAVGQATFALKDNALLVDGKFTVRGDGSAANPYQVPWELLTSVGNLFDPRAGRKEIPGRVAFLDGKFVRIAGFVSFPLMVKQPRELLAMLNQWDGCCIGVPPTPYDAIEVTMAKPIVGNDVMAVAGTVSGEFHVKPYVVGDWLVGLYVMEKGTLVASDWSGAGGF
ncbi:MAG: hypothetical protein HBSAPP03_22650 [Phycisphaerae bacterium]|nr:MAG: hypothetical protein HBSAPP03_22650 [Phycisphaerae bacterium]